MSSPSLPQANWSGKKPLTVFALSIVLLLLYSYFAFTFPDLPKGPGADFKRAYTSMVTEPERLPDNAIQPWTLNPLWQNFFMAPFVTIPWPWGYVLFLAFTIGMTALGAYWFGGNPMIILLSAQFSWVLWWGQLEGWAILALVLGWIGMERKSWVWMFFALALGSFKPQVGFLPVFALWWWSGNDRWKSAGLLAGVFLLTLVIWGPYPLWYAQGILSAQFAASHAEVVQSSLGLWALPLLLLAFILPFNRYQRILAISAAGQLVSPYMPFYSMVILLCFNLPWWIYAFSFLAYLPSFLGTAIAWNGMVLMPLGILAWLYCPFFRTWIQARRPNTPNSS